MDGSGKLGFLVPGGEVRRLMTRPAEQWDMWQDRLSSQPTDPVNLLG